MSEGYLSLDEAASRLGMTRDSLRLKATNGEIPATQDPSGSWIFGIEDVNNFSPSSTGLGSASSSDIMDADDQVLLDESSLYSDSALQSGSGSATVIGMRGRGSGDKNVSLEPPDNEPASDESVVRLGAAGAGDSIAGITDFDDDNLRNNDDLDLGVDDSSVLMGASDANRLHTGEFQLPDDSSSGVQAAPSEEFALDEELDTSFKVSGASDVDLSGVDSGVMRPGGSSDTGIDPAAAAATSDIMDSISLDEDEDIFSDPGDIDITARGPESGINLASPADTGISLDSEQDVHDSEFELSLDSEDSEGDVFETDEYDLGMASFKDAEQSAPTLRGQIASDTEEASESDFELEIDEEEEDESGSEVIAIDDVDGADEEVAAAYDEYEEEEMMMPAGAVAVQHPWPGLLVLPLLLTTIVLGTVGMMMHEVIRNAWSYNKPHELNATVIEKVYQTCKDLGIIPEN